MTNNLAILALLCVFAAPATAERLGIVAAESCYADVARQIVGASASVTSIMSNPDQDPHLFEASPSVARQLSAAAIVVYNGADYDPWMAKLLAATRASDRAIIVVADIVHKRPGDNPHLWYDPPTMPAFATALAVSLSQRDPDHAADYDQHLKSFLASLQPMDARIAAIRSKSAGIPVTATEPVFGYMAAALGFAMHNERFQLATMNNTEPRVSDVAAFENDLRERRVRVLFYNSQTATPATQRLIHIAKQSKLPVIPVSETEPAGKTYQQWMIGELDAVELALSK